MNVTLLLTWLPILLPLLLLWPLYRLHRRIRRLEGFTRGLVAHVTRHPEPIKPENIRAWQLRYEQLEDGAKKEAYRAKLLDCGGLLADGTIVELQ